MILCILGPTASGKTDLSIQLALHFNGEVVSCDSMQIYRGMDIGTAKPTINERKGIPHHMIDVVEPYEPYSAAQYGMQAAICIDKILKKGKLPIICGGTGLYLNALLYGMHKAGECVYDVREELTERAEREGLSSLYAELSKVDPVSASHINQNDKRRIIRALEVYRVTGISLSQHHEFSKSSSPKYDALQLCIHFTNRTVLYDRIDQRVDIMMAAGLFDEVRSVLEHQPPPCYTAMQAIGYKEFAAVLRGETTVEKAVVQIKQSTRRLAKRQITWFRKSDNIRWLETSGANQVPSLLDQAITIMKQAELVK